jgi:hypothetical protein
VLFRSCDPCAADPLSPQELRQLGVFWLNNESDRARFGGAPNVFLSRLHVRYDAAHFPEDMVFQQTADRQSFQGRYILRHPWKGGDQCPAATAYRKELRARYERQAQALAGLTGWDVNKIRGKMNLKAAATVEPAGEEPWWKSLWKD